MLQVLLLLGDGLERLGLLFFVVRASREFGVVHVGFLLGQSAFAGFFAPHASTASASTSVAAVHIAATASASSTTALSTASSCSSTSSCPSSG